MRDSTDPTRRRGLPTSLLAAPFYLLAILCVCYAVLPAEAFAFFHGKGGARSVPVALGMAVVSLLIAVGLHAWLYRKDSEQFEPGFLRTFLVIMTCILGMLFLASWYMAGPRGMPAEVVRREMRHYLVWAGGVVAGSALLTTIGLAGFLYLRIRSHPANRMVRLIAASEYDRAIRLAESLPPGQLDFTTRVNLVVAYVYAGRRDDARALYNELARYREHDEPPRLYTPEALAATLDRLAVMVDLGPPEGA